MDWARILAYVTGTVDQELLTRNEYLAAETLGHQGAICARAAPRSPKRPLDPSSFPSAITYRNNGLRTPGWAPEKAMNRGLFHTKLLTADRRLRAVLVSLSPVVSKAPDFGKTVRIIKRLICQRYST